LRKSLGIPIAVMAATALIVYSIANAPNGLDGIAVFFPGALALLGGVPVFLLAYAALVAALVDRRPIRAGVGTWAAWVVGLVVALCLSALGVAFFGFTFLEAWSSRSLDRFELLLATAVLTAGVAGVVFVVLAVLPSRGAGRRDANQGIERTPSALD
jgi:hypothetical protein